MEATEIRVMLYLDLTVPTREEARHIADALVRDPRVQEIVDDLGGRIDADDEVEWITGPEPPDSN